MIIFHYFKPYADYTLDTTLSKEELLAKLRQFCSSKSSSQSPNYCSFHLEQSQPTLILAPILPGRNSLRGLIHCIIEEKADETGCKLHISIKPADIRWIVCLFQLFAAIHLMVLLAVGKFLLAIIPVAIVAGAFLILHICRGLGENEISQVRLSFMKLLESLENMPKDKVPEHRTSKLDWFTYIANLVVAVPFCGLFGGLLMFFPVRMLAINEMPIPNWLQWHILIILAMELLVLWGRYQYKVCIKKLKCANINGLLLWLLFLMLFNSIFVVCPIVIPTLAGKKSKQLHCISNIKQLGICLYLHACDNGGRLPQKLDYIAGSVYNIPSSLLLCPITGKQYKYVPYPIFQDDANLASMPLLLCELQEHGNMKQKKTPQTYILMADREIVTINTPNSYLDIYNLYAPQLSLENAATLKLCCEAWDRERTQ